MRSPLKVRVYAIVCFESALIGGLVSRVMPEMIAVNGEEPISVVMPARVDEREPCVAQSLPDQSFNHPASYQVACLPLRLAGLEKPDIVRIVGVHPRGSGGRRPVLAALGNIINRIRRRNWFTG